MIRRTWKNLSVRLRFAVLFHRLLWVNWEIISIFWAAARYTAEVEATFSHSLALLLCLVGSRAHEGFVVVLTSVRVSIFSTIYQWNASVYKLLHVALSYLRQENVLFWTGNRSLKSYRIFQGFVEIANERSSERRTPIQLKQERNRFLSWLLIESISC